MKKRCLINIKTWEYMELEFDETDLLISVSTRIEFNHKFYVKKYLGEWSRKQLNNSGLVEVDMSTKPMSLITPGNILYEKGDNKLRLVKLLQGKEV